MFSFMIIWENGKEIKGLDHYELHEIIYNGCDDDRRDVFDELLETGSCEYFDYEYDMKANVIICAETVPKQKKKVFNIKKWIETTWGMNNENEQQAIFYSLKSWALECEGLTKEEMKEKGLLCHDDWLKEVEE